MSTQYLVSYLAALRSLVLKLRECKRDAENIYVIFEFVAGILSYGTVFGNIHSILELMDSTAAVNQAEEYHNFEMEGIISFMKEKKLRPELQQNQPMHVLNGWTIFRKGDEGEEMFFIKSGKVEICSEDGSIIFVTLTAGAFFGEIALFECNPPPFLSPCQANIKTACHRTATARAKGNCELCTLSKEEFNILMNLYPTVAEGIRETIRLRKIQEEEKKKRVEEEAERLRMEEEDKVDDGGGGRGGRGGGGGGHPKRSILKLNGASVSGGRRQSAMLGSRRGSMLASFGVVKEPETQDIDNMLVSVAPMSVDRLPRSNSERKRSMAQTGGRRISFAEFKSPSS
ncbi:UNVERIFIED_CONTAM: Kinesin-like protein kif27 [Siphonaria sp. JEL0065]|nr:Kinesin-like protein kif27 [Siphonaria sp. JEL0065]